MIVKNSGIFFIIIDVIVWIAYFIHNNGLKSIIKEKYILILLMPIVLSFLWSCHTKLVFDNAIQSKHAMSVSNYTNNIKGKEDSDIEFIFNKMLDKIKNTEDFDNIIFWTSFLSFIFMIILAWKDKHLRKFVIEYFALFIVTYILYQISLFGMYLFSMPINEAKNLAGYIRYYRTIVMFEYGISIIVLMNLMNEIEIKNKIKNIIINMFFLLTIILPIIFYKDNLKLLYQKQPLPENSLRSEIISLKEKNNIEENKSYLIYVSNNEKIEIGYLRYICKYDFRSGNVKVIKDFSELQSMDEIFDYDYFIILRNNDEVIEFINKIAGDVNQNVIRFR